MFSKKNKKLFNGQKQIARLRVSGVPDLLDVLHDPPGREGAESGVGVLLEDAAVHLGGRAGEFVVVVVVFGAVAVDGSSSGTERRHCRRPRPSPRRRRRRGFSRTTPPSLLTHTPKRTSFNSFPLSGAGLSPKCFLTYILAFLSPTTVAEEHGS